MVEASAGILQLERYIIGIQFPGKIFHCGIRFLTIRKGSIQFFLVDLELKMMEICIVNRRLPHFAQSLPVCALEKLGQLSPIVGLQQVELPFDPQFYCPVNMWVDSEFNLLRRCFNNTMHLDYCNFGDSMADSVYITVQLDPFMTYVSSTHPVASNTGNLYQFDIGSVPSGFCGGFEITVYLDCDSTVLGQTHCTETHIYPDTFCYQDTSWNGCQVEVAIECINHDTVKFTVKNTGPGDMLAPGGVMVVEDNLLRMDTSVQLSSGESWQHVEVANGSTWMISAEQCEGYPGQSFPIAAVEGCGTNASGGFSMGFMPTYSPDDADPFNNIDWVPNIGSCDPNDKTGFPRGIGAAHNIESNRGLEYRIRFQNTGTDIAFRVVIRDTLSPHLDVGSVVSGVSVTIIFRSTEEIAGRGRVWPETGSGTDCRGVFVY